MNLGAIAALIYGIVALVGGIFGYVKVKSKPSLISGTISGTLLIFSAVAQFVGYSWGLIFAALLTGILIVVFIMRLMKTKKFMPAGLMGILGVVALAVIVSEFV
ncbi:TMEM14 family protein [Oscillatoria salina]|uniref:TMEM14 family protein n=1 Tax=Oscillatoria salina TaxID=331517 RepID=UPI0013B6A57D|nr:TMEM14 family protein [Oscillatoria salina]MBZ8182474.1 hypothetical protein [Oscillatoria salina IIICB1]NET89998.1 hypothetical protein [Kamptonema sp. SIO1D9]